MSGFINYIKSIFQAVWSCMVGMKVTFSYLVRPWKIVTEQYPENRKKLRMQERFRGEIVMPHNEKNEHKCTGCGICEINCPNGTIEVISKQVVLDNGKKKRAIDRHIYRMGMCTFCGLCIKTCPSEALKYGNDFEHAVFNRAKLTKVLNNEGSTLMKGVE